MGKIFNVTGSCDPELHYMVDLSERLSQIRVMVDYGQYFCINRARQYGKTTLLTALSDYLKEDYQIISMDFQTMSSSAFENEQSFVVSFSAELLDTVSEFPDDVEESLLAFAERTARVISLQALFKVLKIWFVKTDKKIVLIIDEVDTATNNQIFIDFLAQLRACYLRRKKIPAFHSVILAGVYDVRNIKVKIRPEQEHKLNSPWNIAAKFCVDMSFSVNDITGMLEDYEADNHTGMDIPLIANLIYNYTSGYPYLVSSLCKLMDEEVSRENTRFADKRRAWTREGFLEAVKKLLYEQSPLFDSLTGKINDYAKLKNMIYRLLFQGQNIVYNPDEPVIQMAKMFGLVKDENSSVVIANRIFETRLYNMFLTSFREQDEEIYTEATRQKNQFIKNGHLNMRLILEKFVQYFDEIYGDREQKFYEEDGRRYFMLYLRPIINGEGNYYIESRTRNNERTDMIIDYQGEQFIIEMKLWRGDAYHTRGEEQLFDYLEYYHLEKGYMLSFNFNKKKEIGVKEFKIRGKILIEAVV